ncbi:MAG: hypothetical protein E7D33_09360 [Klebsiella sp.]|nr:hypothetical protein [Klebsiella sp.]
MQSWSSKDFTADRACEEQVIMLNAGDIFYAEVGCEHVAHPQGAARILVIEKEGSV